MAVQLIGASLSTAIVPEMVRLKGEPDREKTDEFSSATVGIGLGFLLLCMMALLLLRQPFMTILTAGFDETRTHLTSFFFLGLLPCIVRAGMVDYFGWPAECHPSICCRRVSTHASAARPMYYSRFRLGNNYSRGSFNSLSGWSGC